MRILVGRSEERKTGVLLAWGGKGGGGGAPRLRTYLSHRSWQGKEERKKSIRHFYTERRGGGGGHERDLHIIMPHANLAGKKKGEGSSLVPFDGPWDRGERRGEKRGGPRCREGNKFYSLIARMARNRRKKRGIARPLLPFPH